MEQRKHPRYRFHCEIWLRWKEESVAGTVSDLSMRGCKVESEASVYIGMYLALDVFLRDQETPLKVDQAAVRWAKGQEFGLEFLTIGSEEEARLRRFISTLEAGQSH